MKEERDYIRDIAEMRSMMERSSKFLSLSGLSGILFGAYALLGAYIAYKVFSFHPTEIVYPSTNPESLPFSLVKVIFLAILILVMAIATAVFFSHKKAKGRGERLWNPTAKRLLMHMLVPLAAGGLLILVFISKGLIGFIAPLTLLFYGLALFNASKFTYGEVRSLGLIQMALGLTGSLFIEYGLLFWAVGFGVFHIIYGIYLHHKYER